VTGTESGKPQRTQKAQKGLVRRQYVRVTPQLDTDFGHAALDHSEFPVPGPLLTSSPEGAPST